MFLTACNCGYTGGVHLELPSMTIRIDSEGWLHPDYIEWHIRIVCPHCGIHRTDLELRIPSCGSGYEPWVSNRYQGPVDPEINGIIEAELKRRKGR